MSSLDCISLKTCFSHKLPSLDIWKRESSHEERDCVYTVVSNVAINFVQHPGPSQVIASTLSETEASERQTRHSGSAQESLCLASTIGLNYTL